MSRTFYALALLISAAHTSAASAETSASWPQWRGPTRDGQVVGPAWPGALKDDHLKLLWRVDLGPGYSGPIVSADRVFTTETRDKQEEVVTAFDRTTGKKIWSAGWKGSMTVPFFAKENGDWIRATPALDGDFLFVAGMRDVLVCLDVATGKERWRVDFMERYKTPLPAFGFASSPLTDATGVYVQAGASFVKLNKKTGATIWRALPDDGGMNGSAFGSPTLTRLAGREQLLVQTRTQLAGVDPAKGDVLWSQTVKAFRGMNILTPTVFEDGVFTSAYGGQSLLLRVADDAGKLSAKETWVNPAEGYMCSPVVVDGHAYFLLRNQRVICLDLKTGKECWTTKKTFGKYWSLVAQGKHILALDQRGILYLLAANPEKFDLLDERKIADAETWAHLAVVGDQLFIRELNGLAAYRWK
jgi:outer membrane protein assembly factor BamB